MPKTPEFTNSNPKWQCFARNCDSTAHECDVLHRIDDRSRYVLGWSNAGKISALEFEQRQLEKRLGELGSRISELQSEQRELVERSRALVGLVEYGDFRELDWRSVAAEIARLDEEKQQLEHASDLLMALTGRLKEMIIRGGENIYPREIEDFLFTHPKISEVAVFGIPDEFYGEEIMAWIQLHAGETATEEEIREYCKGELAHFKVPRYIRFVEEFPMTVTGKVQKFRMREIQLGDSEQ